MAADYVGDRQTSFDVLCFIDGDTPVNIELQAYGDSVTFAKRIEYHSAHLLNYYVRKGSDFEEIPQTYQISVVDFIFDKDTTDYVSHYQMQTDTQRKLTSRQNIIVIELPKVRKLGIIPPENLTNLQKWCKFFVDNDKKNRQQYITEIAGTEDGIMQAQMTLAELGRTYTQWSAEEARFNAILDRKMEIAHAEQRGEKKKTLKLARKMKAKGYAENDIAEITELSLEQIAEL